MQDCNLVAYSGLAQMDGYNYFTAVYNSGSYSDSANSPCNLTVSSATGGSIFIQDDTAAVIYQEPTPTSLYTFTGVTFSTCTNTGRLGPSLSHCPRAYSQYGAWTNNTMFFNVVNGGIQSWTVPTTGTYKCAPQPAPALSSHAVPVEVLRDAFSMFTDLMRPHAL